MLAATTAGATQVECTVNGLGERAGNAALEEIVMALQTRKTSSAPTANVDATKIYQTSRLVYNIPGLQPPLNKAIVGQNAFAHEAGIHQHGALANRETYEIITPQSIGLPTAAWCWASTAAAMSVESRLSELGHTLSKEELGQVFQSFKELADKKKMVTDRDLEALLKHKKVEEQVEGFKLERFTVNSGNYVTSNAVVRLSKGDKLFEEVAIGDGPIDAAYKAIDKIIDGKPRTLENYSIHSITEGEDALGEAVVKVKSGDAYATGRGLSTDVIEASILAYLNAVNKLLQD